jgi:CRISPR-associated protein Cmr4
VLMAETPVHAGGSESLGAVDLPIQRESATGLPVIWGQSLKGALRQALRDKVGDKPDEVAVFGSRPPGGDEDAETLAQQGDRSLKRGSVSVGDAQLLLFPVAALRECYAWLTSPLLLARLARKATLIGADHRGRLDIRPGHSQAVGTSAWVGPQVFGPFVAQVVNGATAATDLGASIARLAPAFDYTRDKLASDIVTVGDTTLATAAKSATDIIARVQLKADEKTVRHGPFYSEHLPAETLLTAVLASTEPAHLDALAALLDGQAIQLGGDETIGKGVLWCRVLDGAQLTEAFTAGASAAETPALPTGGAPGQPAVETPATPVAASPASVAAKLGPVAAKTGPVAASPAPAAAKPGPVAAKPSPAARPSPAAMATKKRQR